MAYLNKAPPSDSFLRQWMAIASRIHKARLWSPPEFTHPLVQTFIAAIKRRSSPSKPIAEQATTFKEEDLRALFKCLKQNCHPTDKRNWAIAVVQLFGVRRASEVLAL